MEPAPRLPGLYFETPPQPVDTALPRMDLAAFVGLAAAGPLHVPVAVEDAGRFRDVFGGVSGRGLDLAWDDARGEVRRAHMATTVEGFFANGGRSCWVVRVADEDSAVRHRFALPGLVPASGISGSPLPTAEARARAVGSWCEELTVGTALSREPLPLARHLADDAPAVVFAQGGYELTLALQPDRLQAGDLLEIALGNDQPTLLLFVHRIAAHEAGARVLGSPLGTATETPGAFWFEAATVASPPIASPPQESEEEPPAALSEAAGLALAQAWQGSPPDPDQRPAVRRLSFEISLWRGTGLVARLQDLAFDTRHPRFWGALPTDEELFLEVLGRRPAPADATGLDEIDAAPEVSALAAEAAEPRFPLAGPGSDEVEDQYLPFAMGIDRDPATAEPPVGPISGTRLDREGLASFGAELFLDRRLAPLYRGSLLAEAEHHHYLRGQRLRGLHSLLPLADVSLVAIPDAIHRGWTREAPPSVPPLEAPRLAEVGNPDRAGRYPVSWSDIDDATAFHLEWSTDPDFPQSTEAFEGPDTSTLVVLPDTCPRPIYFRVRARRHGEIGPWSNTVTARLPEADFAPCAEDHPGAYLLELLEPSPPGDDTLQWSAEPSNETAAETFEIEEAEDAAFAATRLVGETSGSDFPLPPQSDGTRYYRVRGLLGDLAGPWSNTLIVTTERRTVWTEPAVGSFEDDDLLALQRALLRFCAARGDLMALLALPGHYREEDALAHVGRLTPGASDAAASAAASVPPLTRGESAVLCFGALYHPWLTVRSAPSGGETSHAANNALTRVPPEGTVAGSLAKLSLDRGAWIAPANRSLADVLALSPTLPRAAWPRLTGARVNTLLRRPRGFLTLSSDTLSPDVTCRAIHVRRLLMLLRRLALREGERFVFEPNSLDLRDRVRHRFERVLTDLYRRGAFAGATAAEAFRVRTDETVNPRESVESGRFIVELAVAPAPELAYLTIRLVAGPDQLSVEEV